MFPGCLIQCVGLSQAAINSNLDMRYTQMNPRGTKGCIKVMRQRPTLIHDFPTDSAKARQVQKDLAPAVLLEDRFGRIERVAGVDVGFENGGQITRAALVVLNWLTWEPCQEILVRCPTRFPYVPGLLSFRELPAILEAFERLISTPDLIFCDGQGVAHPRGLGVAAHLGVLTDLPCIGVAKSRLIGSHDELDDIRGASTPLWFSGHRVGTVLRSRKRVRPLYVSPGHRLSQESAPLLVMKALSQYRLPEPIRAAHRLASAPAIRRRAIVQHMKRS